MSKIASFRPAENWNFRLQLRDLEALKLVFDIYDDDCDGVVEMSKLSSLIYSGGIAVTKKQLKALYDERDPLFLPTGKTNAKINLNDYFLIMARLYRDFEDVEVKIRSSLKIFAQDAFEEQKDDEPEVDEDSSESDNTAKQTDSIFNSLFPFLGFGETANTQAVDMPPSHLHDMGRASLANRSMSVYTPSKPATPRLQRDLNGSRTDSMIEVFTGRSTKSKKSFARKDSDAFSSPRLQQKKSDLFFNWNDIQPEIIKEEIHEENGILERDLMVPLSMLRYKLTADTGNGKEDMNQALTNEEAEDFINFLRNCKKIKRDEDQEAIKNEDGTYQFEDESMVVNGADVNYLDLFCVLTQEVQYPSSEDVENEEAIMMQSARETTGFTSNEDEE